MRIYLKAILLLTSAGLAVGNRNRSITVAESQLASKDDEATLLRMERFSGAAKVKKTAAPPALKQPAAAAAKWFLFTGTKWVAPYFDSKDLHCADRELFA
jgi:hypothetical protein